MRKLANDAEIEVALSDLPGWKREGSVLAKTFVFRDFAQAWAFMSRVAQAAERQDHHPDWTNVYNRVAIRLSTHDSGGITKADFKLAAAIESCVPA